MASTLVLRNKPSKASYLTLSATADPGPVVSQVVSPSGEWGPCSDLAPQRFPDRSVPSSKLSKPLSSKYLPPSCLSPFPVPETRWGQKCFLGEAPHTRSWSNVGHGPRMHTPQCFIRGGVSQCRVMPAGHSEPFGSSMGPASHFSPSRCHPTPPNSWLNNRPPALGVMMTGWRQKGHLASTVFFSLKGLWEICEQNGDVKTLFFFCSITQHVVFVSLPGIKTRPPALDTQS